MFVEPEAAELVDDLVLDASIEDEQVTFSLGPQSISDCQGDG